MSEELNVPISELDPKGIKELASKLPPANDINSRLTQTQRVRFS